MCIWKTHVKSGAFSFESFFNLYFVQQLQCNGGKTDIFRNIVTCLWRSGVCSIKYIYSGRVMGFGIVQIKVYNLLQLYILAEKRIVLDISIWDFGLIFFILGLLKRHTVFVRISTIEMLVSNNFASMFNGKSPPLVFAIFDLKHQFCICMTATRLQLRPLTVSRPFVPRPWFPPDRKRHLMREIIHWVSKSTSINHWLLKHRLG